MIRLGTRSLTILAPKSGGVFSSKIKSKSSMDILHLDFGDVQSNVYLNIQLSYMSKKGILLKFNTNF